jgi:hypothetical protein
MKDIETIAARARVEMKTAEHQLVSPPTTAARPPADRAKRRARGS